MQQTIVITTINAKTKAIEAFEKILSDWHIVLIADKKSIKIQDSAKITFLSLDRQKEEAFKLYDTLPFNHYSRKNLGYLYSIKNGASIIYDSDDDNFPYKTWAFPQIKGAYQKISTDSSFYNIYSSYTSKKIWPRGFPLNKINTSPEHIISKEQLEVGAWQGLVDLDPDVDAIFRLIYGDKFYFDKNNPLILNKGIYCPFNSQNTLWNYKMIPYAYLPSTVSFRFTDILRGYIAQRCFWEHNKLLGFTSPNAYQERNEHDLMKDFKSEIPCYLEANRLIKILDKANLSTDYEQNLITIYTALYQNDIVEKKELEILENWLQDLKMCLKIRKEYELLS